MKDQRSILNLTFNRYVPDNAVFVDDHHRIHLLDDGQINHLHQLSNDVVVNDDESRQIFLDWDASPFLYTIADTHRHSCLLFDLRIRNESFRELLIIGQNHPYLGRLETLRGYQASVFNLYQHVFVTDYSLIIIDSRMPNRAVSFL
jgi:DNA-binding sugar fermentation-stimulating protein